MNMKSVLLSALHTLHTSNQHMNVEFKMLKQCGNGNSHWTENENEIVHNTKKRYDAVHSHVTLIHIGSLLL